MSRRDPKRGGITLLGVAGGIAAAMLIVVLNSADEEPAADAPLLIDSAPASTSVPLHAASLDNGVDWSRVEPAAEAPTF